MDPAVPGNVLKDGDWTFPETFQFPVVSKVLVKFFKVAETDQDENSSRKLLSTKIIKVEIAFEKSDLFSKQTLLEAIEREADIKKLAREESIHNPKIDVSVQRKDTSEVYLVTKMKHIVNRLEEVKKKTDTFLVEVKEQIMTFEVKSPTIKIRINNQAPASSLSPLKGRLLNPKAAVALAPELMKLKGSKYERETGRIVCGQCKLKVKPRPKGAAISVLKYFKSTHFDVCGNKEKKRKAKDDLKEEENKKKKDEQEKNKKYWENLSKKGAPQPVDSNSDDEVQDQDLDEENLQLNEATG